jgi:hypothetical protein
VSGLSRLHQGTRHKARAKRQRVDHEAVSGRTAVRHDGAGGVVRVRTENGMTLLFLCVKVAIRLHSYTISLDTLWCRMETDAVLPSPSLAGSSAMGRQRVLAMLHAASVRGRQMAVGYLPMVIGVNGIRWAMHDLP